MNKLKLTKRGIVALSLLLLLLIGAIILNIKLSEGNPEIENNSGSAQNTKNDGNKENADGSDGAQTVNADVYSGYFVNFREERNVVRAQEIEYLRMIIGDSATDADTLSNAQQRLMQLVSDMEQEFSIESSIRAKGFLDAAVTFRNDSVTVIVDAETLSDEEVARILDIVQTETGAPASAVRITLSRAGV